MVSLSSIEIDTDIVMSAALLALHLHVPVPEGAVNLDEISH